MADILTLNGLSIGAVNGSPLPFIAAPSVFPPGTSPAYQIQQAAAQMQSVTTLQYPLDLPKYYMGMQIWKYDRKDLMTVALQTMLNGLAMPFPDQMLDINQVAYDKKGFSSTIGNALNSGFGVFQGAINSGISGNSSAFASAVSQTTEAGAEASLKQIGKGAVVDAGAALTGGAGVGAVGAAGYSPNYFLTVVLDGPQYKEYSLSWTCAPRSPQESLVLRQIIRVLQDAQAPGLALGGALFSFPRVFQNYFAPDQALLYQFKPSVLMSMAVNYTPGGMPSMKQSSDPALQGYHAPTALRIQCNFRELEFWLRGDFGDVGLGASGAQAVSDEVRPQPGNRSAS